MAQRSGVLQWQDDMGRWSGWIICTNSLQNSDAPANYATVDMLSNASNNPGFMAPDNALLDTLNLNVQGVTGISSENSTWAYHLVHCVWYAVDKNEVDAIKAAYTAATDKSGYTIRYSQSGIFPDIPSNVTAIHEGTSAGWVTGRGTLELFVEKFGTVANIIGTSGSIARPVRSTGTDPNSIYVFDYTAPTIPKFIPSSQLIAICFRNLNGTLLWRPMTAGSAYAFGQIAKALTAQVTYTGRVAFVGQTGTWKLGRNNVLWNTQDKPADFANILQSYQVTTDIYCNLPPNSIDGYTLPNNSYWALQDASAIFYEVDLESYIRIQQVGKTRPYPWPYSGNNSLVVAQSSALPISGALPYVYNNTEIVWERVKTRSAQPQISNTPYRLQTVGNCSDPNPVNIFGASSALTLFKSTPDPANLLPTWNRGTNKWETLYKDQVCWTNNGLYASAGIRVCAVMDALIKAKPVMLANLDLATQANNRLQTYTTTLATLTAPSAVGYVTAAQQAAQKLTTDFNNLTDYTNQVTGAIDYYNNTPFVSMDETRINSLGSQVPGWLKLAPEIVQDIETQLAVIGALIEVAIVAQNSTSTTGQDPSKLQAEITSLIAQITAINSQTGTALAEANHAIDRMNKARATVADIKNISNTDNTNIATIAASIQSSKQTAEGAKTDSDNILAAAKSAATSLANSTDTAALSAAIADLEVKVNQVIQDQGTTLNAAIAATSSVAQLEQITLRILLTPVPQPGPLESLGNLFLLPLKLVWSVVELIFSLVTFPFTFVLNLIKGIFNRG